MGAFYTVGFAALHPRLNSDHPFGVKIAKLFTLDIGCSVLDIEYSLFLSFPQGKPLDPSFHWDDRKEALFFTVSRNSMEKSELVSFKPISIALIVIR